MTTPHDAINAAMQQSEMICKAYLEDLTDAEVLVRPVEGANHIAWQLGHLIGSENGMIEMVCPGSMPELPEGFQEKHNNDTAGLDDAGAFLTKAEYLAIGDEQRAGTLAALKTLSADDLDKPAPEALQQIAQTVVGVFTMQPTHWTMHAGQWAIVRRKLGRKPLF